MRVPPVLRSTIVAAWLFGALTLGSLSHHYISLGSPAKPPAAGRVRGGTVAKATMTASYPQPIPQQQSQAQPSGEFFLGLVLGAMASACTTLAVVTGVQAPNRGDRREGPAPEAIPAFFANSFVPNGTFAKRENASGSGSMAAGTSLPDAAVAAVEMADDMAQAMEGWASEYSQGLAKMGKTVDAMVEEANRTASQLPGQQAIAGVWQAIDSKVKEARAATPDWAMPKGRRTLRGPR